MFYGGSLTRRVYMTELAENHRFIGAVLELSDDERNRTQGRPDIKVAIFWHDPTWGRFASDSAALRALKPGDAQPARFLPAHGDMPPVFDYHSAPWRPGFRRITPEGLSILAAHGVPTRVD